MVTKAKPAAKKAVPAKKVPAKTTGKALSPLEKARIARANGTATKRPARKPLPTYKAPADFKPHFILFQFKTERDGLIATQFKATRYQGRFDRNADDKKKFDMAAYDAATVAGIVARLAGVTYKATNDKKMPVTPKERIGLKGSNRLPASTVFQVLIRAGRKVADQTLTARISQVFQSIKNAKTGRPSAKELEKTDPAYRLIRKASRLLPAAFVQSQLPPKRRRGKATEEESED